MDNKMKYKNVGYFAKKKKDPKERQIVITKPIELEKDEKGYYKPLYIQLYDINPRKDEDESKFAERKEWMLKDLVIVTKE